MIGVLGGGQLGRMLGVAAARMGMPIRFFDPAPDAVAGAVGEHVCANYDDEAALRRFARGCEVATYEFENVPIHAVRVVEQQTKVFPPVRALESTQDRLLEKALLRDLGASTVDFAPADSVRELFDAVEQVGVPSILKTRRQGYDGKGQARLRGPDDAQRAWDTVGGLPAILESFAPFDRELSIVAVRGRDGSFASYPLVENSHQDGILRTTIAPAADVSERNAAHAEQIARDLAARLGYVGVFAIEFFEVAGKLIANEIAPRVHNTGHWTIEGAETDQFENHLRAVLGLPLGPTGARGHCVMLNIIGRVPDLSPAWRDGAHVHLYGKTAREGRKLGHITLAGDDRARVRQRADSIRATLDL